MVTLPQKRGPSFIISGLARVTATNCSGRNLLGPVHVIRTKLNFYCFTDDVF